MKQRCEQCPRKCGTDREQKVGFCGVPWDFGVARASLHQWEEPSISGSQGSGTIFFTGCNLRCVFCQNREISLGKNGGRILSAEQLEALMLLLRDRGAHNINLVTPTPYAEQLIPVLQSVKPRLKIPVVYNCGGYESVETLRALDGLIDIYLPDVKYHSSELSSRYSSAPDYFPTAIAALEEMLRQTGTPQLDDARLLTRGTVVRHLVLPACRKDSIDLLSLLAQHFGSDRFLLSLMSQYTPDFAKNAPYASLHRRITSFEYDAVLAHARALGFVGYFQSRASATDSYTPNFDDGDLLRDLL